MSTRITTPDAAKTVGPVTTSAAAGAGVAGAATVLIVWAMTSAGVDVPDPVSQAITTLLAAVGALVGGWLAPSQADAVAQAVREHGVTADQVAETVAAQIPSTEAVATHVTDQVLAAGRSGLDSQQVLDIAGHTAEQVVRAQAEREAVTGAVESTGRHAAVETTTEVESVAAEAVGEGLESPDIEEVVAAAVPTEVETS